MTCVHEDEGAHQFSVTEPHLRADLGRNAGEFRVGCKGTQIIHSFQQRGGRCSALGTVLFREGPI